MEIYNITYDPVVRSYTSTPMDSDFIIPDKIYGNLVEKADKVLSTFYNRKINTGVLLSGLKGNSKTTLAKLICHKAEESNLPVYLVSENYAGDAFKNYLSSLPESIIFIDEFEKIYRTSDEQSELLTILDGVFSRKKLFLFTTNSVELNQYLRNRPSRIFYHFKFFDLEDSLIDEVVNDKLNDLTLQNELKSVLNILGNVSFDALLSIIEELNRYPGKEIKSLISDMNIEVEMVDFELIAFIKGAKINTKVDFNPVVREDVFIDFKDSSGKYGYVSLKMSDYIMIATGSQFIFEAKKSDADVSKMIFIPLKQNKGFNFKNL